MKAKRAKIWIIVSIMWIAMLNPIYAIAAEQGQAIDLSIDSGKVFFTLENLKPGDWSTRSIHISNNGEENFDYIFTAKKTSGSTKFYDALLLQVSDADGELYDGTLGDFNRIEPRSLSSTASEDITITIQVPENLGNAYQGLECEAEFRFSVDGTFGGLLGPDGSQLPNTATGMFMYLLSGVAILMCGLILAIFIERKKGLSRWSS